MKHLVKRIKERIKRIKERTLSILLSKLIRGVLKAIGL